MQQIFPCFPVCQGLALDEFFRIPSGDRDEEEMDLSRGSLSRAWHLTMMLSIHYTTNGIIKMYSAHSMTVSKQTVKTGTNMKKS